jgi:hypothetical protein
MSEEKKELTQEELTLEKLTEGVLSVLSDMSKVLITFRDNMEKIKFYHIAKSLDSVLEHIALDVKELSAMREENKKEVKK